MALTSLPDPTPGLESGAPVTSSSRTTPDAGSPLEYKETV